MGRERERESPFNFMNCLLKQMSRHRWRDREIEKEGQREQGGDYRDEGMEKTDRQV